MAGTRKRASPRPPASRRSAPARSRSRRRRRRRTLPSLGSLLSGGLPRPPALDQRERDVLGLALVAAGVFMGFVLYGGWNGGHAGHGLAVALGWTLGRARALAPVVAPRRWRRAAAAPRAARAATAAHRFGVRVRCGHARARRRHVRAQLRSRQTALTGGAPRICRRTAAWRARPLPARPSAWSRTSAWTSSWSSCCSPA